jgi:hypothetical protein
VACCVLAGRGNHSCSGRMLPPIRPCVLHDVLLVRFSMDRPGRHVLKQRMEHAHGHEAVPAATWMCTFRFVTECGIC